MIAEKIKQQFTDAEVIVETADQVHYYVTVISATFVGMTRIQQHKRIMDLFKTDLAAERIHALSLKTFTPEAWQALNADAEN